MLLIMSKRIRFSKLRVPHGTGLANVTHMKLLVFSDLHRDRDAARSLVERSVEADILVGAEDFAVMRHGIDEVIEILREVDKPTVLVPGNGESDVESREGLCGVGLRTGLHGEVATLEGIPFYGIGGGIPATPFGEWSFYLTRTKWRRC
jgi:Icc-related predicted phosphoesterase